MYIGKVAPFFQRDITKNVIGFYKKHFKSFLVNRVRLARRMEIYKGDQPRRQERRENCRRPKILLIRIGEHKFADGTYQLVIPFNKLTQGSDVGTVIVKFSDAHAVFIIGAAKIGKFLA